MGHEGASADWFAVSELYDQWFERQQAKEVLSGEERVGFLVADYAIRLEMQAFDGLIQSDQRETVAALQSANLSTQAMDLEKALGLASWKAKEEALSNISNSTSLDFLYEAVAAYLRRVAPQVFGVDAEDV
jgi:hypothetical protein